VTVQASLFGIEQQIAETIEEKEDHSRLGRYAEFMVCAELTKLGYYVLHVDAPGFDIILSIDGASWRVQVKSTSLVREGFCRWNLKRHTASNGGRVLRKNIPITRAEADILALFHHQFSNYDLLADWRSCTRSSRQSITARCGSYDSIYSL
jgi:hypothetical protein